ncbi:MAG: hypothetical protein ACYTA5_22170 [Planctomycetota bacterium]|jgi:hypothetical protein
MKTKITTAKLALVTICALAMTMGLVSSASADTNWTGGAADDNWGTNANWDLGHPPFYNDWTVIDNTGPVGTPLFNSTVPNNIRGLAIGRYVNADSNMIVENNTNGYGITSQSGKTAYGIYMGHEPSGTHTIDINDDFFVGNAIYMGSTCLVPGGSLSIINVRAFLNKPAGGFFILGTNYETSPYDAAGELNVFDGGRVFSNTDMYVGDNGTGVVNQYGGLIELDDPGTSDPQLHVGFDSDPDGGLSPSGTVNLLSGFFYTKGFPGINENGTATTAVINFTYGKLGTLHGTGVQAAIEAAITDGDFDNGVTTDYTDPSWHYYQRPAEYNKYQDGNLPTDIWIIAKGPSCDSGVAPAADQDLILGPNTTTDIVYTVRNFGDVSIDYSVVKNPDDGTTAWLTLDKTSGTGLAGSPDGLSGGTDTVTATVDTSSLTVGNYTVDLIFTDDCVTPTVNTRTINLEVVECQWIVAPNPLHVWADCANSQTYTYTVTNEAVSVNNLTYTVAETDDQGNAVAYAWITPSKLSGGPIPPGSSDSLTVTIDPTQTDQSGYLKFTPTCGSGVSEEILQISQWYVADATGQYTYVPLAGYKHAYLGDVDPLLVDSCKHVPPDGEVSGECLFVATCCQAGFTGLIHGTVVDDPDAANGKAFYIDRTETGRAGYSSHVSVEFPEPVNKDTFLGQLGFTMVARVKVLYNQNMGACLYAMNDGTGDAAWMQCALRTGWGGTGPSFPGKIREYYNQDVGGNAITSDLLASTPEQQAAYHTIRITAGGGPYGELVSYRAWYDEQPDSVLAIGNNWGGGYHYMGDRFGFGTYGSSAAGDVYFDWISFTNMGMYGPGEEDDCIGTLIPDFPPPCNIPFADADGDGDVDQDDFAEFQVCYSGGDPGATYPDIPEYCRCFNREGADDDVDDNDFSEFQKCASGPNVPVLGDPDCDFSP